jgi:hypothetical protein
METTSGASNSLVDASVSEASGAEQPPRLSAAMADTFGELVDSIAATDRMLASVSAARAELIDQARQWSEITEAAGDSLASGSPIGNTLADDSAAGNSSSRGWDRATVARRVLISELACALRLPERTVEVLVEESRSLLHDLPATLDALRGGKISYRHAKAMVDHASSLPESARGTFEQSALPFAKQLTVAKFDRKARILRERTHPETIDERHAASAVDRTVSIEPARDGMAWLSAYLPATEAHGIYNRITDIALGLRCPDEPRTLAQLRTDVLSSLLIDGVVHDPDGTALATDVAGGAGLGTGAGIRARVLVTVPVLSLLNVSDEAATLEGYGPIDSATARRLAAHAPGFTRLLTHPETGVVLSVGRDRYAVPSDLRTWLRVRDETCRYPGCSRNASHCDLDHTTDWQYGGDTRHDNLAHLCRYHHNLKHHTDWQLAQTGDGNLEWTSPSGHSYATEPATRIRPAPQRA